MKSHVTGKKRPDLLCDVVYVQGVLVCFDLQGSAPCSSGGRVERYGDFLQGVYYLFIYTIKGRERDCRVGSGGTG